MKVPEVDRETMKICEEMEGFEASESVEKTGTGSRREGEEFERLVLRLWQRFRHIAENGGARISIVDGIGSRRYAKLTVGLRTAFIPTSPSDVIPPSSGEKERWLEVTFGVSDLISVFPTESEAIHRYAPVTGPFAGSAYPEIYSGLTTKFDDTIVLVDSGVLHEKIMLEYKTAKSSKGRQIDGNAHERLSFQIMQYLEVAVKYTKCSLMVLANGAFIRYRNKYHVNFHVQADRLSNFAWFFMEHACTVNEYARFLKTLLRWLFIGTPRTVRLMY